ncbi:hypothetical protein QWY84_05505 [Aquisalimonas lutea]|uniref:hypothetical protein n=1 Tax=Aquisalimonas lutea TaxID=1327750 RepID=UPI0025B28B92|nr:hypothetical protein [Aquisalimonas lutea]MDN3517060.1 hypothetical protein [Aquisalimonas lutea]
MDKFDFFLGAGAVVGLMAVLPFACEHDAGRDFGDPTPYNVVQNRAERCRDGDLQCLAEAYVERAEEACDGRIAGAAQYEHRWSAAPLFRRYVWRDQDAGVIAYGGDAIEFKNGFGSWQRYQYVCLFDTRAQSVRDVSVAPAQG